MEKVSIGSFELHISHTAILKMPEGLSYVITLPEAYVLKKLSTEIGQLVSRKDLEQAGWGSLQATGVNSLAVAISNLRKILKLGKIEIINEPRRGYKLVIDEHIDNYSKINFINEPTNIETKNTITKRNKLEFIFHMYSKLFISLSLMMISLVFILFFLFHGSTLIANIFQKIKFVIFHIIKINWINLISNMKHISHPPLNTSK